MAKTEQYLEGIIEGSLQQITENEIYNKNTIYILDDLPSSNSITNELMQKALSDILIAAYFNINDSFICTDEGAYTMNHIYKWTGNSWEDITPGSSAETDNITININPENKLQAVGITDGESVLNFTEIYQAVSTKWEV